MNRNPQRVLASALAASLLTACDRGDLAGPPTLRVGRDECAECGMLISEDRCASALLIARDGIREHIAFDDIGCMLDYQSHTPADVQIVDAFVLDYESRAWIPAANAHFVYADRERLHTPMASGIVALGSEPAARATQEAFGGEILTYQAVAPARRAWMEARFGKPSAP